MAQYNAWMNRGIYDTCASLPDEERKRDLHAFFGSIHRTLNHLLLTDRMQMGRFVGADRMQSLDEAGRVIEIRSLDQELYADFATLRREREKTDAAIEAWTASNEITARIPRARYDLRRDVRGRPLSSADVDRGHAFFQPSDAPSRPNHDSAESTRTRSRSDRPDGVAQTENDQGRLTNAHPIEPTPLRAK